METIYNKNGKEDIMENLLNDLNLFLCDLNVFYRKLQNFFVIYAKLEEYYDEINEQIDEIAEHILALGGEPLGTLKDYLANTKITEAENKKVDCTTIFNTLIKDYSTLLQDSINIKKSAENSEEYKTSALMDSSIEKYSKILWMLNQTIEK